MESKTAFLRISVAVVILIAPALETHAQVGQSPSSEPLAFDVASIKENKQLADGGSMRLMPDGGVIARHLPARALITIAYDLKTFQLVGAPSWSSDTYFDVNAKTSGGTRAEIFPRLQALLIDRFKLAFHREPREVDGFALVQARPGTLGPHLRPSDVDCGKAFDATPRCKEGSITSAPAGATMNAIGSTLWGLVQTVIGQVGAPVSDETRLTGVFDFELQWSNEVAPTDDLQSIYTALQEQLGLKLEKRRVSTEVFVIERFEPPTPD